MNLLRREGPRSDSVALLKVLHVIPSVSANHGGPSFAIRALARALRSAAVDVSIVTTDDDGPRGRLQVPIAEPVFEENATWWYFRRDFVPYKVSLGAVRWLQGHVRDYNVVHIHALFSFLSTMAARIAYAQQVPYIIRPLGVLNQWGLVNRRRLPKRISLQLIELPMIRRAAALHFTSDAEAEEAKKIDRCVAARRKAVIPLPVEAQAPGDPLVFEQSFPSSRGREVVLFLSRVDPKKGLELAIKALATLKARRPASMLVVAGTGEASYVAKLKDVCAALDLANDVLWTGHLDGAIKAGAFAKARVFVLPSHSENFGIAAAEAMAGGLPVVISAEVGLSSDVRVARAGTVAERTADAIALALEEILDHPEQASAMGEAGKRMVEMKYSPAAIGRELRVLYESIAGTTIAARR